MADATMTEDGQPWTQVQRDVVIASFLGWALDAFDFFLLTFVLDDIAGEFTTSVKAVTLAITLTLAMRPVGAFLFGRVADRYGRRPALMASILAYSVLEAASGFSPNLATLIVLRALYGIAMGGEWGVGASLALETVPVRSRGLVSGMLQAGYPAGYLVASVVYGLLFHLIGWRGMFLVGAAPALLVLYIRSRVPESPVFEARRHAAVSTGSTWTDIAAVVQRHAGLMIYAVVLMTAFNFFSHGTQDLYPTYLKAQRGFGTGTVSTLAIVYNIGAMLGGIVFGTLSGRFGRRLTMAVAALLSLLALPLWAFTTTPVLIGLGSFLMQFLVQGAWGVVPVHLNELSPDEVRGTFPGFVYQLGNLFASYNATMQAGIATQHGSEAHPDYAFALAAVAGVVAVVIAVAALAGPERRAVRFGAPEPATG